MIDFDYAVPYSIKVRRAGFTCFTLEKNDNDNTLVNRFYRKNYSPKVK